MSSLAAAYAGLAGGLYAYFIRTLSVDSFSVTLSIEFIVMIVVGDLGSIGGTLAGVLGISVLVQWLANVGAQPGMPAYMPAVLSYAVYGVLLIVVVRLLPGGLADGATRLADALRRIRRGAAPTADGAARTRRHPRSPRQVPRVDGASSPRARARPTASARLWASSLS